METTHPPEDLMGLDDELEALRRVLQLVTQELIELKRGLVSSPASVEDVLRVLAETRYCIRLALEIEREINGRNVQIGAGATGGDLDLEATRESIGRKLDRLRALHDTE